MPAFSPERLLAHLHAFSAVRYRVAFSGGRDSTVLLHALVRLRDRLGMPVDAIHINHRLHPDAGHWAEHCRAVCAMLGLDCEVVAVEARPGPGESPEAAARAARYAAFAARLLDGDMLLTAHHRGDQAETALLHFLRGAGAHGLAAMPRMRRLGEGRLGRPLLPFSRLELATWAEAEALSWIEDPSNRDMRFDRNFLRASILPALAAWRPGVEQVLVRNAEIAAETATLLDELAADDLAGIMGLQGELDADGLERFGPARAKNALRLWLRQAGLPPPDSRHLKLILNSVLAARWDAESRVAWPGAEVRRYRDRLYALVPRLAVPAGWQGRFGRDGAVDLPAGLGRLSLVECQGAGLRADIDTGALRVRFRVGGERCRPAGRRGHHTVKKLFQEAGVPPWERGSRPLLYLGDELAAVAGLCVCEPFSAGTEETGLMLRWEPRCR